MTDDKRTFTVWLNGNAGHKATMEAQDEFDAAELFRPHDCGQFCDGDWKLWVWVRPAQSHTRAVCVELDREGARYLITDDAREPAALIRLDDHRVRREPQ